MQTFKQLDPREPADPAADERDLESLLDVAQPGWRQAMVQRVFLPHIAGSTALPLAIEGGLAGRRGPRVPGLAGVFLAGDWIGPDGYLSDASLASGRAAARLAIEARRSPTGEAPPRAMTELQHIVNVATPGG